MVQVAVPKLCNTCGCTVVKADAVTIKGERADSTDLYAVCGVKSMLSALVRVWWVHARTIMMAMPPDSIFKVSSSSPLIVSRRPGCLSIRLEVPPSSA